ncbi:uncharacterized protein LOC124207466 [Daphnia pulex]|uniref:uncharacterized protein LOC124207466 n=1 Tax=Daphnia pulex TaxID=6669 RepID=UPI001EE0ABF3|nr:uncharacterized protein LOC124207466 [Daphnia pulex]
MFGFRYITFVGILMLLQHLREADSFALHTNEKRNIDYHDGAVIQLSGKTISIKNVEEELEEANHGGETAVRAKRTALTATIDGKFTVHLIVSVKPAEQVVAVPPRVTKIGRLRTSGGPVQSPAISKSCQNEYCDFAMELELLKQVSKPAVDSTVGEIKKEEEEEANQNQTRSQGRVRIPITPAAAKRDSKLRASRTQATTTRYPMITPTSIKPVLGRNKIETTTTRYYRTSSASNRPSVSNQVLNRTRTGVGRYQSTRIPTNATRFGQIRTNAATRNNPLSIDSREELVLFSEKRNENAQNGPNKSRARQKEGKSPSALLTRFQTTRIHRKKVTDNADVSVGTNESIPTTTEISQVQTANNNSGTDKPECNSNVTFEFDVPIFRDSVEHRKNVSADEINVTTPAAEDVATPTTVGNTIFVMPIPLNRRIMSNVTQLDELKIEPTQNNVTQGRPVSEIPLESMSEDLTTTEETILNPTEISVPIETTENPISINSENSDYFPWEQIGDFEYQINPKSKQVVNIRLLQTTTTTTASYNPVTKSYEEQGNNSSLKEPPGQQDNLDVELGTAATTLEIPATTVIPTQMVTITPTVKLPIPLNRRKPIDGTQSDRVETPLIIQPSREIVIIPARPKEIVEPEQTAIFADNPTSTTQKPELVTLSSEVTTEQVVNRFTESATTISVQQTTITENSQKTEIYSSAEIEKGQDNNRNTSIAEVIPTESGPAIIPPSIHRTEEKDKESYVVEKINFESVKEVEPITSTASGIPIQTTTTSSPMPELSDPTEDFPWEQRHDYEVQVNPTTKEIVNVRLLTTTTPKPLVSIDNFDRTLKSESLLTDEEQDELTMEVLSRILERNGKIRTPKVGDKFFSGVKVPGTRVSVTSSDQTNKNAAAPPIRTVVVPNNNRDRTAHGRKPIFSHSSEDGVFFFRYANDEDPSNADNRKPKLNIDADDEIRETDWNTRRNHVPVRDSPYFYYVQDGTNSSALVKASCYVLFLVACVLVVL